MGGFLGSIAGAALGAVPHLIGGLFSRKNTKDTNNANLRIAQMNNEWSEKMMDKQNLMNIAQWQRESQFAEKQAKDANAFTESMWQKQADYNSASAQADRLRQAGLNPALAMSGQNAGSVTGAQGAQGATPSGNSVGLPSPTSATMQTDNFGQFVARSVESAAMMARNQADIERIRTETDAIKAKTSSDLAKQYEETRDLKFKNKLQEDMRNLTITQMNEDYLTSVQSRMNMEAQAKLYQQQQILMSKEVQWFDQRTQQQIATMVSQEALNLVNTQYTRKDIERVSREIERVIVETSNINYSPTQRDRLLEAIVKNTEHALVQGYVGSFANLIGSIGSLGNLKPKPANITNHTHSHTHGQTTTNIYNDKPK